MHKLYFVKLHGMGDDAVFLFTARDEKDAEQKGIEMINPLYQSQFKMTECRFVCNTPDIVLCFEPC